MFLDWFKQHRELKAHNTELVAQVARLTDAQEQSNKQHSATVEALRDQYNHTESIRVEQITDLKKQLEDQKLHYENLLQAERADKRHFMKLSNVIVDEQPVFRPDGTTTEPELTANGFVQRKTRTPGQLILEAMKMEEDLRAKEIEELRSLAEETVQLQRERDGQIAE